MNKVWRERAGLFHSVDYRQRQHVCILPKIKMITFSRFVGIADEHGLNSCDELLLLLLAVRLNDWKAKKSGPDNSSHMLFGVGLGNVKLAPTNACCLGHLRVDKQGNAVFWNGAANELGAG